MAVVRAGDVCGQKEQERQKVVRGQGLSTDRQTDTLRGLRVGQKENWTQRH